MWVFVLWCRMLNVCSLKIGPHDPYCPSARFDIFYCVYISAPYLSSCEVLKLIYSKSSACQKTNKQDCLLDTVTQLPQRARVGATTACRVLLVIVWPLKIEWKRNSWGQVAQTVSLQSCGVCWHAVRHEWFNCLNYSLLVVIWGCHLNKTCSFNH